MVFSFRADIQFEANSIDDALLKLTNHFLYLNSKQANIDKMKNESLRFLGKFDIKKISE